MLNGYILNLLNVMKRLYEIPRESRIDVTHLGLINAETKEPVTELNFHHVDGMYSFCTDNYGNAIHLKATTEVKVL